MITSNAKTGRRSVSARMMMNPRAAALAAVLIAGTTAVALAQAGGATAIGNFKDWNAFTSTDANGKMCFVATQPTDSKYSQPVSGRDAAFFQITRIPTKNVVNEASSIVGYTFASGAEVTIDIDGTKFKMFLDDSHPDTAWAVPDQEAALIEAMKKGHQLTLTGKSKRGTTVTDIYSLQGVSAALDKLGKDCP